MLLLNLLLFYLILIGVAFSSSSKVAPALHDSIIQYYNSESRLLSKPFTLKIPVMLPISGDRAPLGKMCTESIELFLSIINNRQDILPDYNVVYDIVDDQCSDTRAVKAMVPFFIEGNRIVSLTSPEANIGDHCLPANKTFLHETAKKAYIPPFVIGGMCSAVCKAVARYVHLFDIINFSAGCSIGTLSDPAVYPNLYRIMSGMQIADTAASLLKVMHWDKVALLSDYTIASLMITNESISLFHKRGITVAAVEIYMDDPAESIARIKASGARVIDVNCYYEMCVALACEAYKQELYGPRIIWMFPGSTDFINAKTLPDNCTTEMLKRIDFGSFFIHQIPPDYLSTPIEVGLTGQDFDTFLEGVVPNMWKDPLIDSRWMCFDSVAPSVFVMDKVERRLNANGTSIRKYIEQPSKRAELREIVREAMTSIDIRIFSGRVRYNPGKQEILVPTGYEQSQINNTRKMVFMDRGVDAEDDEKSRFQFLDQPIMWLTKDGKMPKMEPTLIIQEKSVPLFVGGIFSVVSIVLILLAIALILMNLGLRWHRKIRQMYPFAANTALIGMIVLLAIIVLFPSGNMTIFCQFAPSMAIFGYSLLNGALFLKVSYKSLIATQPPHSTNYSGSISQRRAIRIALYENQRRIVQNRTKLRCIVMWMLVNAVLCIVCYSRGGIPVTRSNIISKTDDDADVIWRDIWVTCAAPMGDTKVGDLYLKICAGSIMALQGVCLLSAMFLALMIRRSYATSDVKRTIQAIYILFPASVAAVLTVSIAETPDVIYCFLSCVVILKCIVIMQRLFASKSKLYIRSIKRWLNVFGITTITTTTTATTGPRFSSYNAAGEDEPVSAVQLVYRNSV